MRLMTWILSYLLLCACSTNHKIDIPKPPCLYPFVDYNFTICQPFYYLVDGQRHVVPMGFTTDLASVPRILWSIYSPNKANTIPPAVIHDYLYFCPGEMSRSEADSIFYDALIYKHVNTRTAFKYWIAVRAFGFTHFNEGAQCTFSTSGVDNTAGLHREIGEG